MLGIGFWGAGFPRHREGGQGRQGKIKGRLRNPSRKPTCEVDPFSLIFFVLPLMVGALKENPERLSCLVVSTPLKNISQNGNLPQIGVKIKNL